MMGPWAAERVLEIIRGSGKRPAERSVDVGFNIKERGSSAARASLHRQPA